MRECRNSSARGKVEAMDDLLMEKREVQAIANYLRSFHGADSFVTALERARTLSEAGELATAAVWNQIAEEISHIETCDVLERYLKRPA